MYLQKGKPLASSRFMSNVCLHHNTFQVHDKSELALLVSTGCRRTDCGGLVVAVHSYVRILVRAGLRTQEVMTGIFMEGIFKQGRCEGVLIWRGSARVVSVASPNEDMQLVPCRSIIAM